MTGKRSLIFRLKQIENTLQARKRQLTKPQAYSIDWLRSFVPEYFPLPSPPFHHEIADALPRYDRIVITAPRGSAKSTVVTLGYPLYCLLFDDNVRYILIVSDTFSQAAKLLASIQHALERNNLEHQHSASRVNYKGKLVEALGAGCRVRGRRWKQDRPNLIVLDDPQGHLDLISESAREARWDWFLRDLLPAGAQNCQYIVVGTTIHEGSIVHRLRKDWPSLAYAALTLPTNMDLWSQWWNLPKEQRDGFFAQHKEQMTQGVSLLWPERWDLPALMEAYFSLGEDVFRSEYLQEPSLGTTQPLFVHLVSEDRLVDRVPDFLPCNLLAVDPAYSTKTSADWCAVTCFHCDWSTRTLFVEGYTHRGDWVSFVVQLTNLKRPADVVVETNASMGQACNAVLHAWMQTNNDWSPRVRGHYWSSFDNKHRRIVSGVYRLFSGEWNVRITKTSTELINELRYYPASRFDDSLDSLVLGLRYLFPTATY